MHRSRFTLPLAVLSLTALAAAQESLPAGLALDFRAPVHASAEPGSEALCAAGEDYKVHFEDEAIRFVPVLGAEAPRSLSLRWRTVAPVAAARAERCAEPWRVEYRRGAIVERYDVLPHGLEQSFVLEEPPDLTQDFVVRGAIETELRCASRDAAHQELVFADEHGNPIVAYGAALAFDAAGRTTPLESCFDGEEIALVVKRAWLAEARFPVTIDPLLSRQTLAYASTLVTSTATARGARTSAPYTERVIVVATRAAAGNDIDLYAWTLDADLSNSTLVLTRLDSTQGFSNAQADFCASGLRFVIAAKRGASTAIFRTHPFASTVLNFGHELDVAVPAATFALATSNASGSSCLALLAWSANDAVEARRILVADPPSEAGSYSFASHGGVQRAPALCSAMGSGWMLAMSRTNAAGYLKSAVVRIPSSGTSSVVTTDVGYLPQDPRHELQLRLDGYQGNYALSYGLDADPQATRVETLRLRLFSWLNSQAQPTLHEEVEITPVSSHYAYRNDALAADPHTSSLWAAGYTRSSRATPAARTFYLERLGHAGGEVEIAAAFSSNVGTNPVAIAGLSIGRAVLHDTAFPRTPHFPIAFGTTQPSQPIYVQLFGHGDAQVSVQTQGCGGYINCATPFAGRSGQWVTLDGADAQLPAFLLIGAAPLDLPLDSLGAPGCTLAVDPIVALPYAPSGTSGFVFTFFDLPDAPVLTGDLYLQWLWLQSGAQANLLGARLTDSLKLEIR